MIADSLTLPNGTILKNRIVKSAMSEALGDAGNNPTPALIALFARWSSGGAGLLITGNTPVDRMHLEHAGNFVVDGASDLTLVRELASAAKSGGAKILAQLAHAGRFGHRCPRKPRTHGRPRRPNAAAPSVLREGARQETERTRGRADAWDVAASRASAHRGHAVGKAEL